MAKNLPPIKQQRQAMNNVTTRSIVFILVKAANETSRGNIPGFLAMPNAEKELSLAAVVMQASFLETWMNFADEHWNLKLPTKKPAVKIGAKQQNAGLEYKLHIMLKLAKKKLVGFKLSSKERSLVLKKMNAADIAVSDCIRIRNKVAHGQPYAATKNNGRYQQAISKTMQQMTLQSLSDMVEGVGSFTNFCEIMLDPKWPVKRLVHKKRILADTLRVAIAP